MKELVQDAPAGSILKNENVVSFTDAHEKGKGKTDSLSRREVLRLEKEKEKLERKAEKEREKHEAALRKAAREEEREKKREEARKRREEEKRKFRLKTVEMHQIVNNALNRIINALPINDPDVWPGIWLDEKKSPRVIEINPEDNTCGEVSLAYIKSAITRYVVSASLIDPDFSWTAAQIHQCAEYWLLYTFPKPKPKAWAFKNDPELCFKRHNFVPDPSLPTPVFDEMMGRILDADTLMAWVGSLFFRESFGQQYFTLQGEGGDGKGGFARFLHNIFGEEYFGVQDPPKNQFFGTMFSGKRVVCFQDLRDMSFYQSAILLGVTGGDALQLERKGVDVKNERSDCRILILQNNKYRPKIYNTAHDLRRILWSSIDPLPGNTKKLSDKEYDTKLFQEAAGFIGKCIAAYERRCPAHEPLEQPKNVRDIIESFCDDNEFGESREEFAEFTHQVFAIIPKLSPNQPHCERQFVSTRTVNDLIKKEYPNSKDRSAFKSWLRAHGCVDGQKSGRGRVWYGLGLKNGRLVENQEWTF